ncbi:hypothetical protein OUZ56_025528 [Daphnia magna]|uniref:Peptidase A2 domain-containing protein n=1 Tax=Daphnia magna TaxID=35525 RepID=A0ABQ9ZK46_9CRUS|nr:hypothetical protein OUZ56_025528 [Daphnia magna]
MPHRQARTQELFQRHQMYHGHHPLLHGSEFIPLRKLSDPTTPTASTSFAFLGTLTQKETVKRHAHFNIVPVRISVGARWVDTFGVLDTGSDTTLISRVKVKKLGLFGQPKCINVVSYDGATSNVQAAVVDFSLSSFDGTSRFEVKHAFAIDNLKVTPSPPPPNQPSSNGVLDTPTWS